MIDISISHYFNILSLKQLGHFSQRRDWSIRCILALENILGNRKLFLGHVKKFDGTIYFIIFCLSGISFSLGKFGYIDVGDGFWKRFMSV